MNTKRILALLAVIILSGGAVAALVFALIGNVTLAMVCIMGGIMLAIIIHLFLMLNNARHGKSVMDETYSYREKKDPRTEDTAPKE